MKAVVLHGPDDLRVEEVETPQPGEGEALLRVTACGICGSDLARVAGEAHRFPIILGHEFSGTVEAVGTGVRRWKVGQRVAAIPLVPCFKCGWCRKGCYSLCRDYSFLGSSLPGAMAEYCVVPQRNLIRMSRGVSAVQAASMEPATVPLHALLMLPSRLRSSETLVVLGVGTIGLYAVQWAKARVRSRIIAVDVRDSVLELAREFGADVIINAASEDAVEAVMAQTEGEGAHVVVETAGVARSQVDAWRMVRGRGVVIQVGTAPAPVEFPPEVFERLLRREITVKGSWMSYSKPFPGREWKMTADAFAKGVLRCEPMISGRFSLEEAVEAFEFCRDPQKGWGKVMFEVGR